jgi:hypothetical protein
MTAGRAGGCAPAGAMSKAIRTKAGEPKAADNSRMTLPLMVIEPRVHDPAVGRFATRRRRPVDRRS